MINMGDNCYISKVGTTTGGHNQLLAFTRRAIIARQLTNTMFILRFFEQFTDAHARFISARPGGSEIHRC